MATAPSTSGVIQQAASHPATQHTAMTVATNASLSDQARETAVRDRREEMLVLLRMPMLN